MRDPDQTAIELRWFWREADGDMGLRSNFQATELKLSGIYPSGYALRDPNPRAIWAASRYGRIEKRLQQMEPRVYQVLFAAYGIPKVPDGLERLGVTAGVLLELEEAKDAWRTSRTGRSLGDWLARLLRRSKGNQADRQTIAILIGRAQRALEAAERRYAPW